MPIPLFHSSSLGQGAPLSWRPPESQLSRCIAERRGVFKHNISDSSFSSTFFFFLLSFDNQSGMVAWTYL